MRAALALLLVASSVLAGCSGNDGGTDPITPAAAADLVFRTPVDLGSKTALVPFGTRCMDSLADGDCGLGEPQVEVDGLGQVYVSGVCCLGTAPPVYVSRDGGATFSELTTPAGVRESFGIEGDFAVDGLGRVYFGDIEFAATFQVTVWDAEGNFIRHTKWPAPPLVDRDWVRAEGDGIVYYVYNTGSETLTYVSTNAAATFTAQAVHSTPWALGTATKGPAEGELWVAGGNDNGFQRADATFDQGVTWALETTTLPDGDGNTPGAFDNGGNLYLTTSQDDRIVVARRDADRAWQEAVNVTTAGRHRLPWIAAGADGVVAVAWYGAPEGDDWLLHAAVSADHGSTWQAVVADPEVVFTGDLADQLLDFLQVDMGPDGAVHIAYSKKPQDASNNERLHYVRSEAVEAWAATDYLNGPHG